MTRANTEQAKHVPWFAKAGAACSIVPIARFVSANIFALKGGGYGCLFALTGVDEEGLTDQELESHFVMSRRRLRGLPEGSCLYQYTRVMRGFALPRQQNYASPVTETLRPNGSLFWTERGFRRIDLHWCLTLEPSKVKAFERKPEENTLDTSRLLAELAEDRNAPRRQSRQFTRSRSARQAATPSSSSAISSTSKTGPSRTSFAETRA